ncbi:MAG TPA: hypothetical protein VIM09_05955 [Chthoniobacterales bacterium]
MKIFRQPFDTVHRRRFPRKHVLLACASILLSASVFATPAEEITRAVTVNGVADVSQARPRQFVKAFTAVALRVPPRELPDYVIAAINLRPDLAPNVVGVAIKSAVKNSEANPAALCAMIERIVRAGITANPDAAVSITKAATAASPELRKCVVEAAIAVMPEAKDAIVHAATATTIPFAFLTFSASDTSGFSFTAATLSPANISNLGGDGNVNSPEQPPSH